MTIKLFTSLLSLSVGAAEWITELSHKAIFERGECTIALSGGETPKTLYETLAKNYAEKIDWDHVHLFWGDERFVPEMDAASNYRMVREALIDKSPISSKNVHPIFYRSNPTDSADQYSGELAGFFKEQVPSFDLMLLGLGGDGHTASLFPGMSVEEMSKGIAIVTNSPLPPPIRISLTLPIINNAKHVAFLVSGSGKREILKAVLHDREVPNSKYPAAHVQPKGELVWFVDPAANPS